MSQLSIIDLLDRIEFKARESGSLSDAIAWYQLYCEFAPDIFPQTIEVSLPIATGPEVRVPVRLEFRSVREITHENWAEHYQELYGGSIAVGGANFVIELQRVRNYDNGECVTQEAGRDPYDNCKYAWGRSDGAFETCRFPELPGEWLVMIFPNGKDW